MKNLVSVLIGVNQVEYSDTAFVYLAGQTFSQRGHTHKMRRTIGHVSIDVKWWSS